MTTSLVIQQANIDGIATPELDLEILLRLSVIPKFLSDVGYTSWRRTIHNATIDAGLSQITLPVNAGHIKKLMIGPDFTKEVEYAGDTTLDALAIDITDTGAPTKYYFVTAAGGNLIQLNSTLSEETNFRLMYDVSGIFGRDLTTNVDLDNYIPEQWQWALVEGLKEEIYDRRFGAGDKRAERAASKYAGWVARASESREMTHPRREIYVR